MLLIIASLGSLGVAVFRRRARSPARVLRRIWTSVAKSPAAAGPRLTARPLPSTIPVKEAAR